MGGTNNNQTPKQQLNNLVNGAKKWKKTNILKEMRTAASTLKTILQPTRIENAFLEQTKKKLERSYASAQNAIKVGTVYNYLVDYCDEVLRVLEKNPELKLPRGVTKIELNQTIEELKDATAATYEKIINPTKIESKELHNDQGSRKEEEREEFDKKMHSAKRYENGEEKKKITKRPLPPIPSRGGTEKKTPPPLPPRKGTITSEVVTPGGEARDEKSNVLETAEIDDLPNGSINEQIVQPTQPPTSDSESSVMDGLNALSTNISGLKTKIENKKTEKEMVDGLYDIADELNFMLAANMTLRDHVRKVYDDFGELGNPDVDRKRTSDQNANGLLVYLYAARQILEESYNASKLTHENEKNVLRDAVLDLDQAVYDEYKKFNPTWIPTGRTMARKTIKQVIEKAAEDVRSLQYYHMRFSQTKDEMMFHLEQAIYGIKKCLLELRPKFYDIKKLKTPRLTIDLSTPMADIRKQIADFFDPILSALKSPAIRQAHSKFGDEKSKLEIEMENVSTGILSALDECAQQFS